MHKVLSQYSGVVFDVYGTLLSMPEARNTPYLSLFRWLKATGRKPSSADSSWVLKQNMDFQELAVSLGNPPDELLSQWTFDLEKDLETISVFEDVKKTIENLLCRGIKIAICSNAAFPYSKPFQKLLGAYDIQQVWSFEVAAVKPESAIYDQCARVLSLPFSEILFVGDSIEADFHGPTAIGMGAKLLQRDQLSDNGRHIKNLLELI